MKVCDFGHHHMKHKMHHKGCHHKCQHRLKGCQSSHPNYQKECKQFKMNRGGHGGNCRKGFVFKRHAPYHGCQHGHHTADHHGFHLRHQHGHQHQRHKHFDEGNKCQHSHRPTENFDLCQHSERPRPDSHSCQRECQNHAGDQNALIAGPSCCKQRSKSV